MTVNYKYIENTRFTSDPLSQGGIGAIAETRRSHTEFSPIFLEPEVLGDEIRNSQTAG
jgi:hypothetical protein